MEYVRRKASSKQSAQKNTAEHAESGAEIDSARQRSRDNLSAAVFQLLDIRKRLREPEMDETVRAILIEEVDAALELIGDAKNDCERIFSLAG